MNYKGEKLEKAYIDFLYGEMDAEERKEFEEFLKKNESAMKKHEEFRTVREIMGKLPDREVIEPVVLMGNPARSGFNRLLKPLIGIAAAILLLLISGYIFNASLTFTQGTLSLTLGNGGMDKTTELNDQEITARINETVQQENQAILKRLNSLEENVETTESDDLEAHNDQAITPDEREEIKSILVEFQRENISLIQDLLHASKVEQQEYMEELMISFSEHFQKQRLADLQMINEGFRTLKNDTDQKYYLTEDLIADVMYEFTNSK